MFTKDDSFKQQESIKTPQRESTQTFRQTAKRDVAGFVRRMKYENYVRSGIRPEEAALRVGVRLPPGVNLNSTEILRIIERGIPPKRL